MLSCKSQFAKATQPLVDPLKHLEAKGAHVRLFQGEVILTFDDRVTREARVALYEYMRRYRPVLALQLAVGPKERPRTVQQLVAVGKLKLRQGRYVVAYDR